MNQKYTDEEVSKAVERIHSRIVYPQRIQKEKWSVLFNLKFVFFASSNDTLGLSLRGCLRAPSC